MHTQCCWWRIYKLSKFFSLFLTSNKNYVASKKCGNVDVDGFKTYVVSVFMHVCMHVCILFMCVEMLMCMCMASNVVLVCMHVCISMFVFTYVYMYVFVYVVKRAWSVFDPLQHTYTCIYMHTCIHAYACHDPFWSSAAYMQTFMHTYRHLFTDPETD